MQALQVTDFGTPPRLQTIESPLPGAGEIQVRIAACGLNFADLLMQTGAYQDTPALPFTMGMEVAGTVSALGDGTTGPAAGTRVAVFGGSGGLAEFGIYPAAIAVPLRLALQAASV